jgi:hypothetical protein
VDFADLWIELRGLRAKVFLSTLRLSFSGKAVHKAFASQSQEAFLDGHRYAFERLGGVPFDKIRYDNLKSAVSRVLFRPGSGRIGAVGSATDTGSDDILRHADLTPRRCGLKVNKHCGTVDRGIAKNPTTDGEPLECLP